jgi:hypothetical protein
MGLDHKIENGSKIDIPHLCPPWKYGIPPPTGKLLINNFAVITFFY